MNKLAAIQAMKEGKSVVHTYFCTGEFVKMVNGKIHDVKGYNLNSEFLHWRHGPAWENGWSIKDEPEITMTLHAPPPLPDIKFYSGENHGPIGAILKKKKHR